MALLTTDEAITLAPSLAGADLAQLELILEGASTAAERYTRRTFESAEATEYYDWPSPGSRPEIRLKRRPVTAVASVRIDPRGGAGQIDDTFGSDTLLTDGEDYAFDGEAGLLTIIRARSDWPMAAFSFFASAGQPFPYGSNLRNQRPNTIQVTYTAGYNPVPADVKMAVAQLVAWLAGGAIEAGGRAVSRYIDVSMSTGESLDALTYGNSPSLGSARSILGAYREPAFSRGRW